MSNSKLSMIANDVSTFRHLACGFASSKPSHANSVIDLGHRHYRDEQMIAFADAINQLLGNRILWMFHMVITRQH